MTDRFVNNSPLRTAIFAMAMLLCSRSSYAWSEQNCPFRRSIEMLLETNRITGEETAMVELLAPGLLDQEKGTDLRIESDDGNLVAMRVIKNTADDRASIVFNPIKGKSKYYVYWGGKLDEKQSADEPKQAAGLLAEMKRLGSGSIDSLDQLEKLFNQSGEVQTRVMLDRLFIGYNPTLATYPNVGKITGTLYAPIDGEYQFALSADDRGGVKLDGKELVFARGAVGRARFNTSIQLKRGPHPLEYYHVDTGGDWMVSFVWKRPDMQQYDAIAADSFGRVVQTKTGKLEQKDKLASADFSMYWQGETIIANQSTYRIRLDTPPYDKKDDFKITWDFGDGQTGSGASVSHVFLKPGKYAINCQIKNAKLTDSKTFNLQIGRDPNRIIEPAQDLPEKQADLIANYDFTKLSPDQQVAALRVLARAKRVDDSIKCLGEVCKQTVHSQPDQVYDGIDETIELAEKNSKIPELARALANIPPKSDLLPKAADLQANVLLWRLADFKLASEVLQKMPDSRNIKRLRMQSLLLNNQIDSAKKELASIAPDPEVTKKTALSGAYARSVEYYIRNKELDSAEQTWEDWQRRFPDTFWEGYSMLLKVQMLEPNFPQIAAKTAEAFAIAVPDSAYAPELLDRASKILSSSDPEKSKDIRKMLKEKYPEDPQSQSPSSQK